jgi:hypothetical protein
MIVGTAEERGSTQRGKAATQCVIASPRYKSEILNPNEIQNSKSKAILSTHHDEGTANYANSIHWRILA